jgi:hypothetical protein
MEKICFKFKRVQILILENKKAENVFHSNRNMLLTMLKLNFVHTGLDLKKKNFKLILGLVDLYRTKSLKFLFK